MTKFKTQDCLTSEMLSAGCGIVSAVVVCTALCVCLTGQLFPVFLEDRLLVIEQLLGEVRYSQTRMREGLSPLFQA